MSYIKTKERGIFKRGASFYYTAHVTDAAGHTKQTWIYGGTSITAAKSAREDMRRDRRRNEWVMPTPRLTVGDWLDRWLAQAVRPSMRGGTVYQYDLIVRCHLKPALGRIRLQALQPGDVQRYFGERREKLSAATLRLHGCVLSAALSSALRQKLVAHNVCALVDGKPSAADPQADSKKNVYTRTEARALLAGAKTLSPQLAALTAVAFDSGARKGELGALTWSDINFDDGTIAIDKTLHRPTKDTAVLAGPPKTKRSRRTIRLDAETVNHPREHKRV
jgi:integrase